MIACIALLVPTPDLEVPTPATAGCGQIRIFRQMADAPLFRSQMADVRQMADPPLFRSQSEI